MKLLWRAGIALVAVWGIFLGFLYWAMCQPPASFGAIMRHVPMPAMMVVPFEPLWNSARGGSVEVGQAAPDFELPTLDRKSRVRLSESRGRMPVVLVFGSYT